MIYSVYYLIPFIVHCSFTIILCSLLHFIISIISVSKYLEVIANPSTYMMLLWFNSQLQFKSRVTIFYVHSTWGNTIWVLSFFVQYIFFYLSPENCESPSSCNDFTLPLAFKLGKHVEVSEYMYDIDWLQVYPCDEFQWYQWITLSAFPEMYSRQHWISRSSRGNNAVSSLILSDFLLPFGVKFTTYATHIH